MYFPIIDDSPVVEKPKSIAETVPNEKRILLIDDEELVRELGKRILEQAGYRVITAANGKEALEIYVKERSNIDMVVLDLIMPHMSGEKCLEELLKINPHLKAVVSTGQTLDSKDRDRRGAYTKGFVNKPYQMKQFLEVVRVALVVG